jgi:hypothetical protein
LGQKKNMLKKQLFLSISLIIFTGVLGALVMGAKTLNYPLLKNPPLPFGNIIIALGFIALPCIFYFGVSSFYYPVNQKERLFSLFYKVLIGIAVLWFPLGYLLSGNFAFNFGSTPDFQGGQLALKIFWAFNYILGLLPFLLLATFGLLKLLPQKKKMNSGQKLSAAEVAHILKGLAKGFLKFKFAPGYYWSGKTTVVIEFYCKGYAINIFVDAGELDYVEHATAPDGRTGHYDYWEVEEYPGKEPLDYLTNSEYDALIKRFEKHPRN